MSFKTKILILSALSLGLTTLFGVGVFAQSNYETFLKQLDLLKVTDQDFVQKSAITRYDLARIMNLVECKDCLNPEQKMIDRYDQDYWSVFLTLPGKDFLDIPFRGALAGNKSYYYCVAYVGDKSYMRGYPIATSPYCPGKFCGSNLTTKAEFLQVIFNILSNYAYNNYSVNRSNVKKRYDGLDKNSYQARTLDATDVQRIQQGVEQCAANTCLLTQSGSLRTYVKYCMFNLNACGFQEFGATKQGTRPVAELNVLLRQNILTIDEAVATKISDQVSADEAIRVLYRLQQQVKCSFNTDYDCDGVTNASDNCPNAFNPNQTDTDNDGIGDVCDDDIDGDTIKNPIGIVDYQGLVNIKLWSKVIDNCLFQPNTDQTDKNKNQRGDLCEGAAGGGLTIGITSVQGELPLEVAFQKEGSSSVKGPFVRDFADGSQANGERLVHTFVQPGLYTVTLRTIDGVYRASTTIKVGGKSTNGFGLQLQPSLLHGEALPATVQVIPVIEGTGTQYEWNYGNQVVRSSVLQPLSVLFTQNGSVPVVLKVFQGQKLIAASALTISVGPDVPAVQLKASALQVQQGSSLQFSTIFAGLNSQDVNAYERDFGDGTKVSNKQSSISKIYTKPGNYSVIQTIITKNAQRFINVVTITVLAPNQLRSVAPQLTVSSFVAQPSQSVTLTTNLNKLPFGDVQTIVWSYGDGLADRSNGAQSQTVRSTHRYEGGGLRYPVVSVNAAGCVQLTQSATLSVVQQDQCLDAVINGTLGKYRCDMDNDEIPDICDDDIDGDGKKNPLGIIRSEKGNCSYGADNVNVNIFAQLFKQGGELCQLDNCSFVSNPTQDDVNVNRIGDVCEQSSLVIAAENLSEQEGDQDKDGIVDSQDACPTIPELYNTIQDSDGCPEIGVQDQCQSAALQVCSPDKPCIAAVNCTQCPCPYVDSAGVINLGDRVRAVLTDPLGLYRYSVSPEKTFQR